MKVVWRITQILYPRYLAIAVRRTRTGSKAIKIIRLCRSCWLVNCVLSTVYTNQLNEKQILCYLLQFSCWRPPELEVRMWNWSNQQSLLSGVATEINMSPNRCCSPDSKDDTRASGCLGTNELNLRLMSCSVGNTAPKYESTVFSPCILSRAVARVT